VKVSVGELVTRQQDDKGAEMLVTDRSMINSLRVSARSQAMYSRDASEMREHQDRLREVR
jgi:hypothetical protein